MIEFVQGLLPHIANSGAIEHPLTATNKKIAAYMVNIRRISH
jgi:hypothetical protein